MIIFPLGREPTQKPKLFFLDESRDDPFFYFSSPKCINRDGGRLFSCIICVARTLSLSRNLALFSPLSDSLCLFLHSFRLLSFLPFFIVVSLCLCSFVSGFLCFFRSVCLSFSRSFFRYFFVLIISYCLYLFVSLFMLSFVLSLFLSFFHSLFSLFLSFVLCLFCLYFCHYFLLFYRSLFL